jgi:hypothetical protein
MLIQNLEYVIMSSEQIRYSAEMIEKLILENIFKLSERKFNSLDEFTSILLKLERESQGVAKKIRDSVKADHALFDFLSDSIFSNIGETLVGEQLKLHNVIRFRTTMSSQDFTISSPHQDNALWPEDKNQINFWLPLCDIGLNNAPLLIYPGTGNTSYKHQLNEYNLLEIPIESMPKSLPVPLPVKKGEVIAFCPNLIHHSDKMLDEDTVRFSLDFRYSIKDNNQ